MILPTNKVWRIFLHLCRALATKVTSPNPNYVKMHLQHLDQRGSLMLFPGNLLGPRVPHPFGKELRHHCLLYGQGCHFIHPRQLSLFPERLKLPFSSEEILSGFEDIVSSGTDQFTAWVKTDPHAALVRHMVDVQKATADFREASERRHDTLSQTNRFNKRISNRSPVQKRLSIYNWSRFHVTHYGGCAILFGKDTVDPKIDVKSIYCNTRRDLPDQVMEGEPGWVMQGILSRASFCRPATQRPGDFYGVVSTHKQHLRQKERHCQEAHPHHPCYHDWSGD